MKRAQAGAKHGPALDAAESLLGLDGLIDGGGEFQTEPAAYYAFREKIAAAIVVLNQLIGQP